MRWEDKATIGYHGLQEPPEIVTALDINRPIVDRGNLYDDLLVGYRISLLADKVQARIQLDVRNLTESGRLQPASRYRDPAYRLPPRRPALVLRAAAGESETQLVGGPDKEAWLDVRNRPRDPTGRRRPGRVAPRNFAGDTRDARRETYHRHAEGGW